MEASHETTMSMQIEIDKMEPQTEEYSLTRSFIHLFSTLTSHPLSTPLTFGVQVGVCVCVCGGPCDVSSINAFDFGVMGCA